MAKCYNLAFIFIGDSDIARWPKQLLPQVPAAVVSSQTNSDHNNPIFHVTTFHHAENGATMQSLAAQIKRAKKEVSLSSLLSSSIPHQQFDMTVFIACAGENDLSSCSSNASEGMDRILGQFELAVHSIFSSSSQSTKQMPNPNLIFIGPKVEPWMETDELYARMSYFQLSERLRSSIAKLSSCPDTTTTVDSDRKKNNEKNGYSIYFLDSLTLFCGETGNKSIVGGQAIAQRTYFDEDELHLGQNGYEIWKKRVEEILKDIIAITCGKMVDRT